MKKISEFFKSKKGSYVLGAIACVVVVLFVIVVSRADKIQSIFDPSAFMPQDQQEEQKFDAVGYGLKDNKDSTSDNGSGSNEEDSSQSDSNSRKTRQLNTNVPESGYRGNQNSKDTSNSNKKVYINNGNDGNGTTGRNPINDGDNGGDNGQNPGNGNNGNGNNDGNGNGNGGNNSDNTTDPGGNTGGDDDTDTDDKGNGGGITTTPQTEWVFDDLEISYDYDTKKESVNIYTGMKATLDYVRGNITVRSVWHDKADASRTKKEREKSYDLSAIPVAYRNRVLGTSDIDKTFNLTLTYKDISKKVKCTILYDSLNYQRLEVTYKSTPKYSKGEALIDTPIREAITVDVYGITQYKGNPFHLTDETNYRIEFKAGSNGVADPSYVTADLVYMGNEEGVAERLRKKDVIIYQVVNHKLVVQRLAEDGNNASGDDLILATIYTNDNTVWLNKTYDGVCPYNKMISELQASGKYTTNKDGYLTSLFFGWSSIPNPSKDMAAISYTFKTGQDSQIMYAVPLEELLDAGYLVKQEGSDQVLVGYKGDGKGKKTTLEVPYGITKVDLSDSFITSEETKDLTTITIPDTVNSMDLSGAGDVFSKLAAYKVSEKSAIYKSGEDGILYSADEKTLIKVPETVTKFQVKQRVTDIAEDAFKDCASCAAKKNETLDITMNQENVPILHVADQKTVFGEAINNVSITVPVTQTQSKVTDHILKKYVSVWGGQIDSEKEEGYTLSNVLKTTDDAQKKYYNIKGDVYSRSGEEKTLEYVTAEASSIYNVEDGTNRLGAYAFSDNQSVLAINVTDTVTSIETNAFSCEDKDKSYLQSVQINGDEKIEIGDKIFGEEPMSGIRIYMSSIQNEISGWMEKLTADYGQETAEKMLVITDTNLWMDAKGCIYALDSKADKTLILYSVPSTLTSYEEPTGYKVSQLHEGAFQNCSGIVYLELPDVKKIEKNAFTGCSSLEILVLSSEQLETVEDTFQGCTALEHVVTLNEITCQIPAGVKLVQGSDYFAADRVVYHKTGSNYEVVNVPTDMEGKVTLLEGTQAVLDRAFYGCDAVTEIENNAIADLKKIGSYAFYGCKKLEGSILTTNLFDDTSVTGNTLEINAESVGEYAFYNCDDIEVVTLKEGCTTLGAGAFKDCVHIQQVNWQANTTSVGDGVFKNCGNLSKVIFGNYLTKTGLPDITEVGAHTFEGDSSLAQVHFKARIRNFKEYCFADCYNMQLINYIQYAQYNVESTAIRSMDQVETIGAYAFKNCAGMADSFSNATELKTIGEGAFMNCTDILGMYIPKNVEIIGDYCFTGCSKISYLQFDQDNEKITSIGKGAFSGCTAMTQILNLSYMKTLTTIKESAFSSITIEGRDYDACTSLTSATIGSGMVTIEKRAFAGCTSLSAISCSSASNLKNMGEEVLEGCEAMESVDLTNTKMTTLSKGMFADCKTLTSVNLPNTVKKLEGKLFVGCEELSSIISMNNTDVMDVAEDTFEEVWEHTTLKVMVPYTEGHGLRDQYRQTQAWKATLHDRQDEVIEDLTFDDTTFMENGALYRTLSDGSYELVKVFSYTHGISMIKTGTTIIDPEAYTDCSKCSIVRLPDSVKSIPDGLFKDCTGLEALVCEGDTPCVLEGSLFGTGQVNENFAIWTSDANKEAFAGWTSYPVSTYGEDVRFNGGAIYGDSMIQGANVRTLYYIPRSLKGSFAIMESTQYIEASAGENCTNLTELISAHTVIEFGARAFAGCTSLKGVDFTGTSTTKLTTIGDYCFEGCTSLIGYHGTQDAERLYMPSTIRNLGKGVFKNCTSLTYLNFQCLVTKIPEEFCSGCTSLVNFAPTSTTLKMVETIGKNAFYNCSSILSISWSNMPVLQKIEASAYEGCTNLVEATFANQISSFGDRAFYNTGLEIMSFNGTSAPTLGTEVMDSDTQSRVIVFVLKSAVDTFYNAWNTKYPVFAAHVVGQDGSSFRAVSNVLYLVNPQNSAQLTAMRIPTSLSAATLYDSASLYCMAIGDNALEKCAKIKSFIVTTRVKTIGKQSFSGCSALASVTINSSVLTNIKEEAFLNCESLTSLTLPTSVTDIETGMLKGCTSFKELNVKGYTPYKLGSKIFGDKVAEDVRIVVPYESYDEYIKYWGSALDKDYGTGSGVRIIKAMDDTHLIENGIHYEKDENGKWKEVTKNADPASVKEDEAPTDVIDPVSDGSTDQKEETTGDDTSDTSQADQDPTAPSTEDAPEQTTEDSSQGSIQEAEETSTEAKETTENTTSSTAKSHETTGTGASESSTRNSAGTDTTTQYKE